MIRRLLVPLLMSWFLLGSAVTVAVLSVAERDVVDQPWGTQCRLDWCRPDAAPVTDPIEAGLQRAADIARAGEGHGCRPVDDWPRDQIPAGMVVTKAGTTTYATWTYPAPPDTDVEELCTR